VNRRFVFRVLVAALVTVSAAATIGQTPPPRAEARLPRLPKPAASPS